MSPEELLPGYTTEYESSAHISNPGDGEDSDVVVKPGREAAEYHNHCYMCVTGDLKIEPMNVPLLGRYVSLAGMLYCGTIELMRAITNPTR